VGRVAGFELSLEQTWIDIRKEDKNAGLGQKFYGRWKPEDSVPALFMSATSVNQGIPLLISQLNFSSSSGGQSSQIAGVFARRAGVARNDRRFRKYQSLLNKTDQTTSTIANILDFRPDLQLRVSTAVGLSARFPYVTPPGNLSSNPEVETYQKVKTLELMDGGFFDNSGMYVAESLLGTIGLARDSLPDMKSQLTLHLIEFTHSRVVIEGKSNTNSHFELITPLATFEAVRSARKPPAAWDAFSKDRVINRVELFDQEFEAPVSWLLSRPTKFKIEVRSGGREPVAEDEKICCSLQTSFSKDIVRVDIKKNEAARYADVGTLERYVPNSAVFNRIVWAIHEGDRPRKLQPAPAPAPAPPPEPAR
jgi:hypothetical protein